MSWESPGPANVSRTGQNLRERYKDIRNTGRDVHDLYIRVENVWLHIAFQLSTVQSAGDEVPPVLRDHIGALLDKLVLCLHTACENIDRVMDNTGKTKALRLALFLKGSLVKDVSALEQWRDVFNSAFYMLSMPKNATFDPQFSIEVPMNAPPVGSVVPEVKAIQRDVLADETTKRFSSVWLAPMRMSFPNPIGYSGSHIVLDESTHTKYIMETITIDQGRKDYGQLDRDVTKLARALRESKDIPGILTCKGVVRKVGMDGLPEEFQFILEIPHGLDDTPSCLRSVLHRSKHEPPSREDRVLLALQIVNAVIFVHNLNLVHKNLRPDAILIFPEPENTPGGPFILGVPFVLGYQMFRSADGFTYRSGDDSWAKNLYRHPSRQGTHPDNVYTVLHDIYSLGVILLEIGLWSPFVDSAGLAGEVVSQIVPFLQDRDQRKGATRIKKHFVSMARGYLPERIGAKYADTVVTCLTCLDRDSMLGSEIESLLDDGILVGVRFFKRVSPVRCIDHHLV